MSPLAALKPSDGLTTVPSNLFDWGRFASGVEVGRPTVLDLFAGAGGFSLGFEAAGFQVARAIEIDEWACDTLAENHHRTSVQRANIAEMTDSELAEAVDGMDVIVGGPPCQGFSVSNNGADPKDPRNSLFEDFVRAASLGEPSVILLENVPGLLRRKTAAGEPVIDVIGEEFRRVGYEPHVQVLQAVEYGVPQLRPRLFVLGLRGEVDNPFPLPTHFSAPTTDQLSLGVSDPSAELRRSVSLWEAIGDLPSIDARQGAEVAQYDNDPVNDFQELMRGRSSELYNHKAMNHSDRIVERFAALSWGDSGSDAPEHLRARRRNGGGELSGKDYDQNNRRMHPDRPCHTIPASFYANFVHPRDNRNFTPREGARIQTFPDWYRFRGKPTVVSQKLLKREGRTAEQHLCQYNQIGNAVPPLLAYHLAEHVISQGFVAK